VNNIGDDGDMPRLDILARAAELTEISGLEVGSEKNVGRRQVMDPERRD
jgi:hypothetical protein